VLHIEVVGHLVAEVVDCLLLHFLSHLLIHLSDFLQDIERVISTVRILVFVWDVLAEGEASLFNDLLVHGVGARLICVEE